MPQLDKVTFLSQFFWLCFFYIGFYFLLVKNFLPKMSRILKLRKRKTGFSGENLGLLHKENENVATLSDQIVTKGFSVSRSLLIQQSKEFSAWLEKLKKKNNQTLFQSLNKRYLESVGEGVFLENLTVSEIGFQPPEKVALHYVIGKAPTGSEKLGSSKKIKKGV